MLTGVTDVREWWHTRTRMFPQIAFAPPIKPRPLPPPLSLLSPPSSLLPPLSTSFPHWVTWLTETRLDFCLWLGTAGVWIDFAVGGSFWLRSCHRVLVGWTSFCFFQSALPFQLEFEHWEPLFGCLKIKENWRLTRASYGGWNITFQLEFAVSQYFRKRFPKNGLAWKRHSSFYLCFC